MARFSVYPPDFGFFGVELSLVFKDVLPGSGRLAVLISVLFYEFMGNCCDKPI